MADREKRTKRIGVRVTERERDAVQGAADGERLPLSLWIRRVLERGVKQGSG